ncbi:MAG: glycosyltransferase family 2 protein [Pseudomonadota bacterium]
MRSIARVTQFRVPLVVIPCLNEAAHLRGLVEHMHRAAARHGGHVVIVDGGSTDGSVGIATDLAHTYPRVRSMHNPARLQSAGINAAVRKFGAGHTDLIRIDAHARYPSDYIDVLLAEAAETGAGAVTVGMIAEGQGPLQHLAAATQNTKLGNGGSAHRARGTGTWVEHGHHALIRLPAFAVVGGYDETFAHNEDAEFDHRLRRAGYGIWQTGKTVIGYYPRDGVAALAKQYFNYGRGRARNLRKHRTRPRLRQTAMIAVAPAMAMALFSPLSLVAALPAAVWAAAILTAALALALAARSPKLIWSAPLAAIMHACWSAGFWTAMFRPKHQMGQTL